MLLASRHALHSCTQTKPRRRLAVAASSENRVVVTNPVAGPQQVALGQPTPPVAPQQQSFTAHAAQNTGSQSQLDPSASTRSTSRVDSSNTLTPPSSNAAAAAASSTGADSRSGNYSQPVAGASSPPTAAGSGDASVGTPEAKTSSAGTLNASTSSSSTGVDSSRGASVDATAAPAAAAHATIDWAAKRRQRLIDDLVEALQRTSKKNGNRRGVHPSRLPSSAASTAPSAEQLQAGLSQLEALLGLEPNLEVLTASQWASLLTDTKAVANTVIAIKVAWPRMDVRDLARKYPRILLATPEQVISEAQQVRELLATAKDADALVQAVPQLLTPRTAASILVTVTKWYQLEKDPVEVLERDPDLVRRAQENDVPFEPVYQDKDGKWMVPLLNYREKRTEWQAYIDRTRYKQP